MILVTPDKMVTVKDVGTDDIIQPQGCEGIYRITGFLRFPGQCATRITARCISGHEDSKCCLHIYVSDEHEFMRYRELIVPDGSFLIP